MKRKFLLVLSLLSASFLMHGCSDTTDIRVPPPPENHNHDLATVQSWICANLCEWYLWYEDVAAKTPDYSQPYNEFFRAMLSRNRNDGRTYSSGHQFFSTIEERPAGTRWSVTADMGFGFEYQYASFIENYGGTTKQMVYVQVVYVVPGSPAEAEGLKRGDYIGTIGGSRMTIDNYGLTASQIAGGATASAVTVATYKIEPTNQTWGQYTVMESTQNDSFDLSPAPIEDSPVHLTKVIDLGGKKVGYVVYNTFDDGDNNKYHNDLKLKFKELANRDIRELVLDLRYNGGGLVNTCRLLTSLIYKTPNTNERMMLLTYNDKKNDSNGGWLYFLRAAEMTQPSHFGSETGINLGMSRLYVLVSGNTASSSEVLINSLRGANMPVHIIGTTTLGKNVGSSPLSPSNTYGGRYNGKDYYMQPIMFSVKNALGEGEFADGFTPSFRCDEQEYLEMSPLGDENEPLLSAALYHIQNGVYPSGTRGSDYSVRSEALASHSSPANRRIQGIIRTGDVETAWD